MSLQDVTAQHVGRPAAELDTALRLHAVAHGDDNVEAVVGNRTLLPGNMQILYITAFYQLFLFEHIIDVARDDCLCPLEELTHLFSGEPNSLTIQVDRERDLPVRGGEQNDVVLVVCSHAAAPLSLQEETISVQLWVPDFAGADGQGRVPAWEGRVNHRPSSRSSRRHVPSGASVPALALSHTLSIS